MTEHAFDPELGAFTQLYGSKALDASVLQIPQQGFLPANDPRMLAIVRAIERHLVRDGLVRRYATERSLDGLTGDEGVFVPCSLWFADNYVFQGRLGEAEALFERLRTTSALSPTAFTHLALVNTARRRRAVASAENSYAEVVCAY